MPADIIIIAAIAIFILLRLRSVLGKGGQGEPPAHIKDAMKQEQDRVVQLYKKHVTGEEIDDEEDAEVTKAEEKETEMTEGLDADIADGIEQIRKINSDFRITDFLEGSKFAFDMVMEAFAKDDRTTLKPLLSKQVYSNFKSALIERKASDEYEEITLISVLDSTPLSVKIERNKAIITAQITSEQIRVTRSQDGEVVGGDASNIATAEDEWVFEKDLKSSDPNWIITAT